MGTIIKLADKRSGIGSMDDLYGSVEALDDEKCFLEKASKTMLLNPQKAQTLIKQKIISTESKEMLLSPKLQRMFACRYQLLQVQEDTTPEFIRYSNCDCSDEQKKASLDSEVALQLMNPKRRGMTASGGRFVNESRLLVTDNLEIKPLSTVSDMFQASYYSL